MACPNIPEITLKQFKYKKNQYIGSFFQDIQNSGHANKVNFATLINVVHNRLDYLADQPLNKNTWIGNKYHWSQTGLIVPQGRPEPKTRGISKRAFRKSVIKYAMKNKYNKITDGCGDLQNFLTAKMVDIPNGMFPRLIDGRLQLMKGFYVQCNKCHAISWASLPNADDIERLKPDVTKAQIAELLEACMRKKLDDMGALVLPTWMAELGMDGFMLGFMSMMQDIDACGISCFNCDDNICEFTEKVFYHNLSAKIALTDYGINAALLEEFKKTLNLDGAPPDEYNKSQASYNKYMNIQVNDELKKMDRNIVNLSHEINSGKLTLRGFQTPIFAASQSISNVELLQVEVEEIALINEVAVMCGGNINCHPSGINVYHAVHKFVNTTCNSSWFMDSEMNINSHIDSDCVTLLPLFDFLTVEDICKHEALLLVPRVENTDGVHVTGAGLLTEVTSSNVPCKWNIKLANMLYNSSSLTVSGISFKLHTIKSTERFDVMQLEEVKSLNKHARLRIGKTQVSVMLPVIDVNSLFKTMGVFGTKWEQRVIDVDLVYRLLTNAISGRKSTTGLMSYLAGIMSTKYNVGGKITDLTRVSAQDGIPELTYVLMLLNDNVRTLSWIKMNYSGSVDLLAARKTTYSVLLSKALRGMKQLAPSLFEGVKSFMLNKTNLMYARDNSQLKGNLQANYKDIQPFELIYNHTDLNINEINIAARVVGCEHHKSKCMHGGTGGECLCCGMSTLSYEQVYCECCASASARPIACYHKMTKNKFCSTRALSKPCTHAYRCECCDQISCFQTCKDCYSDTKTIVEHYDNNFDKRRHYKKPVMSLHTDNDNIVRNENEDKHKASDLTTRNTAFSWVTGAVGGDKSKIQTPIQHTDDRGTQNKKHALRRIKKLTVGDQTISFNNIDSIDDFNDAWVVMDDNKVYNLYNCIKRTVLVNTSWDTASVYNPIEVQENCALACIANQTNYTWEELISSFNTGGDTNITQLRAIVQTLNLNAVIGVYDTAEIIRAGALTDPYVLIAHSSTKMITAPNHWFIPTLPKFNSAPKGWWDTRDLSMLNKAQLREDAFYMSKEAKRKEISKLNGIISSVMTTNVDVNIELPTLKTISGRHYLSNGNHNDIRTGAVNVEVDEDCARVVQLAMNTNTEQLELASIVLVTDSSTTVSTLLRSKIEDTCRNIHMRKMELRDSKNWARTVDVVAGNSPYIILPSELRTHKALDIIAVEYENGSVQLKTVQKSSIGTFLNDLTGIVVKMGSLKSSIGSLIRYLVSLLQAKNYLDNFNTVSIVKNVNGLGGSGKTTSARKLSKSNAFVCKLRNVVDNMKDAGFKYCNTIEQFVIDKPDVEGIIVDEATMIDIIDMLRMCHKPNLKVYLYSDSEQLGLTDFSDTPGIRLLEPYTITCGVPQENWTINYRYGQPLVDEVLKMVYPTITTKANHTTTYDVVMKEELDDVMEYIVENEFTAVYCYYEDHLRHLQNIKPASCSTEIRKIHANQGTQSKKVLVLFWSALREVNGILSNRKYLITALTRSEEHVTLMTNIPGVYNIPELINSLHTGKGMPQTDLIDLRDLRLNRPMTVDEMAMLSQIIPTLITGAKANNICQSSVELEFEVDNHQIHFKFGTHDIIPLNTKTALALKFMRHKFIKHLQTINKVLISGDLPTELLTHSYTIGDTNKTNDGWFTWAKNLVFKPTVKPMNISTCKHVVYKLKLDYRNWARVITIADVVLMAQTSGVQIPLIIAGEEFYLKCFHGCSLFCGITFKHEKLGTCQLSSGHAYDTDSLMILLTGNIRTLSGDIDCVDFVSRAFRDETSILGAKCSFKLTAKRIIERLKVIAQVKSHSEDVERLGRYFEDINQQFVDEYNRYTGSDVVGYGHQKINDLLYSVYDKHYIYPSKKPVKTLNDVIKLYRPIAGFENHPMNVTNQNLADNILNKKLIAEYSGKLKVLVPASTLNLYRDVLSTTINMRNLQPVSTVSADDTVAGIINPIMLMYMYKVLNIESLQVLDMNVQSITLQNLETYWKPKSSLSNIEAHYVTSIIKDKFNSLEVSLKSSVNQVDKIEITNKLSAMKTTLPFIGSHATETCIIGLGGTYRSEKKHIYFIKADPGAPGISSVSGVGMMLVGDNGRIMDNQLTDYDHVEIFRLGHFSLCKMVSQKKLEIKRSYITTHNMHTFIFPDNALAPVNIPHDIYKKLIARCYFEDTNEEDLLAYARTLCAARMYTTNFVNLMYNINQDELMLYILVVLNVVKRNKAFFSAVDKMRMSSSDDLTTTIISSIKSKLLTFAIEAFEEFHIGEFIQSLASHYKRVVEQYPIANSIIEAIKDVDIVEVSGVTKVIIYQATKKPTILTKLLGDKGKSKHEVTAKLAELFRTMPSTSTESSNAPTNYSNVSAVISSTKHEAKQPHNAVKVDSAEKTRTRDKAKVAFDIPDMDTQRGTDGQIQDDDDVESSEVGSKIESENWSDEEDNVSDKYEDFMKRFEIQDQSDEERDSISSLVSFSSHHKPEKPETVKLYSHITDTQSMLESHKLPRELLVEEEIKDDDDDESPKSMTDMESIHSIDEEIEQSNFKDEDDYLGSAVVLQTGKTVEVYKSNDFIDLSKVDKNKLYKGLPFYTHQCDVCPQIPLDYLNEFEKVADALFKQVTKFFNDRGIKFIITKGTLLGAMRYGSLTADVDLNLNGVTNTFVNWTDTDFDIIAFQPMSAKPTTKFFLPQLFSDLSKELQAKPLARGNDSYWSCCIFNRKMVNKFDLTGAQDIFMGEPVYEGVSVDVGIAYYDDSHVYFDDYHLWDHAGIGKPCILPIHLALPHPDISVKLYGVEVSLSRFALLHLRAMAGDLTRVNQLALPYLRSIMHSAMCACDNYKISETHFTPVLSALWMANANFFGSPELLIGAEAESIFQTCTANYNTSSTGIFKFCFVFAGSKGDAVPLQAWLDIVERNTNSIIVLKPADMYVRTNAVTLNYTDSYNVLVDKATNWRVLGNTDLYKHLISTVTKAKVRCDICISMFFSREADFIDFNKMYKIMPIVDTTWKPITLRAPLTVLSNVFSLAPLIKNVTYVRCVPSVLKFKELNVGMALTSHNFVSDKTTDQVIRTMHNSKLKWNLVTFGSMNSGNVVKNAQFALAMCELPVIFVKGRLSASSNFTIAGNEYDVNAELFDEKLIIVSNVNFFLIREYIKNVYHHGGCGTMSTFLSNEINQTILPVKFDQPYNAKIYDNFKHITVDFTTEVNHFDLAVSELLGFPHSTESFQYKPAIVDYANVNTEGRRTNSSIIVDKVAIVNFAISKTFTSEDCVYYSIISGMGLKLTQKVKSLYEQHKALCGFFDLKDVIEFCMSTNLNWVVGCDAQFIRITHKKNIDGYAEYIRLFIDNDMKHCDNFEGEVVVMNTVGELTPNDLRYCIPESEVNRNSECLELLLHRLSSLKQDTGVKCEYLPSEKDIEIVNNFSPIKGLKTRMRKAIPILTDLTCACAYGYVDNRFTPGYTYAVYTSDGMMPGFGMKNQITGSIVCVVPEPHPKAYAIAYRLHAVKNKIVTRNIKPLGTTLITTINHSTLKFCKQNNILVNSVGDMNADIVYVWETWNRKHHLEREHELLMRSRVILVPTMKLWKSEDVEHKFPMRNIALQGKLKTIIECAQETYELCFKHEPILNVDYLPAVNCLDVTNLYKQDRLVVASWFTPNTTDTQIIANCVVRSTRVGKPETALTFSEICSLHRYDAMRDDTNAVTEMLKLHGMQIETAKFEPSVKKLSTSIWEKVIKHRILIADEYIAMSDNFLVYQPIVSGAGIEINEATLWSSTEVDYRVRNANDDKTASKDVKTNSGNAITGFESKSSANDNYMNLDALLLEDATIHPAESVVSTNPMQQTVVIESYDQLNKVEQLTIIKLDDTPDMKTVDYWDNFSEQRDAVIIMPTNKAYNFKGSIEPVSVKPSVKIAMEQYPMYARPSMTTKYGEELNSFTSRFGASKDYRKKKMSHKNEYLLFKKNYYKQNMTELLSGYHANPIVFSKEATFKWVKEHSFTAAVEKELKEVLEQGFEKYQLASVEVHGKTEQTTKIGKMSRWMDEVVTRSIVAQRYAISALFSPIYKEVKSRFMHMLARKFKYVDGMTTSQINDFMRTFSSTNYVIEDDITQQDSHTTSDINIVEKMVYEDLGLSVEVSDIYMSCHKNWKWKGHGISGFGDAMRLTGQVTTALGNAVTNLIIHNQFVKKNHAVIELVLFLGDDIIFLSNKQLDVTAHGTITKNLYNMITKVSQREKVGGFLSMVLHCLDAQPELCPHYKRMRHRYSVCNYTFTELERTEKINSRTLSYCFMLGPIERSMALASSLSPGVTVPKWYNVSAAIAANALYDKSNEQTVMMNISKLTEMMSQRITHSYTASVLSSKP